MLHFYFIIYIFDSNEYDDSLNKTLSEQLTHVCVAVDLLDGDCLQIVLWKNGRKINTYLSEPECIELKRTKSNSGNARRWKDVTLKTESLQSIFDNDEDAITKLFSFAEVLGLPNNLAQMQYTYLDELKNVNVIYLRFCEKNKPPIPEKPVLQFDGIGVPLQINKGQETDNSFNPPKTIVHTSNSFKMETRFLNTGNVCASIVLNILGESIEDKTVVFDKVQLFEGWGGESSKPIVELALQKANFQDGRNGYSLNIDNLKIPFSITFYESIMKGKANKEIEKRYKPFTIKLFGKVLKKSDTPNAVLFVHPSENYEKGYSHANLFSDVTFKP